MKNSESELCTNNENKKRSIPHVKWSTHYFFLQNKQYLSYLRIRNSPNLLHVEVYYSKLQCMYTSFT